MRVALSSTVQAAGASSTTPNYAPNKNEYAQSNPKDGMHADNDRRSKLDTNKYVQTRHSFPQQENYIKEPEGKRRRKAKQVEKSEADKTKRDQLPTMWVLTGGHRKRNLPTGRPRPPILARQTKGTRLGYRKTSACVFSGRRASQANKNFCRGHSHAARDAEDSPKTVLEPVLLCKKRRSYTFTYIYICLYTYIYI